MPSLSLPIILAPDLWLSIQLKFPFRALQNVTTFTISIAPEWFHMRELLPSQGDKMYAFVYYSHNYHFFYIL